jgi:hypothetical protein
MSEPKSKGPDWNPLDGYRDTCNERCNAIWKYMDGLSEHIKSLPEGQTKVYLQQYSNTLSLIAELYFFQAVSLGQIRGMEGGVIQTLFKEVFKDRTITLPYEPKEGETLHDVIKRYKDKEPIIDWQIRDLTDQAKDLENGDDPNK